MSAWLWQARPCCQGPRLGLSSYMYVTLHPRESCAAASSQHGSRVHGAEGVCMEQRVCVAWSRGCVSQNECAPEAERPERRAVRTQIFFVPSILLLPVNPYSVEFNSGFGVGAYSTCRHHTHGVGPRYCNRYGMHITVGVRYEGISSSRPPQGPSPSVSHGISESHDSSHSQFTKQNDTKDNAQAPQGYQGTQGACCVNGSGFSWHLSCQACEPLLTRSRHSPPTSPRGRRLSCAVLGLHTLRPRGWFN